MIRKPAPPVDLAAFFGLSDEEAQSLGLAAQRPPASDAATPASPLTAPSGSLALAEGVDATAGASAPETQLPERADQLPWPTEAEMLACVTSEDAPVTAEPSAARRWIAVPVLPLSEDLDREEEAPTPDGRVGARRAWIAPPGAPGAWRAAEEAANQMALEHADAAMAARDESPADAALGTMPLRPLPDPPAMADGGARDAGDVATAGEDALSPMARELLNVFMEEATELLDSLHTSLESLERAPAADCVIEARRTVHTIKGGARMCGLQALTELAHACEDLIGARTTGVSSLPSAHLAILFDAEQEMRAALGRPRAGPGSDTSVLALTARVCTLAAPAQRVGAAPSIPAARLMPAPRMEQPASCPAQASHEARAATGSAADARQARTPEDAGHVTTPEDARHAATQAPRTTAAALPAQAAHGSRISVDLQKVEDIVAKVTEIVANRASAHGLMDALSATVLDSMRTVQRLHTVATQLQYQVVTHGLDTGGERDAWGLALETYGPVRQLLQQLQEAVGDQQALVQATMDLVTNRRALAAVEARLDTELQGALLNMRLTPMSQLRVRLDQVVRSAAATAGREVRWSMEGQQVALDKHVCDRLFEPLMHVLRNAIDHGIEPPDEREQRGKSRAGRIVVQAAIEGNQAMVSVSDDGRGMDPARIAQVAVTRGVITAAQARALSDREKLELIFRPGFSTSQTVTDLSGRGMGMEIVREACTRMGGSVTISPRSGGGTVVALQVPLSMSVVHALIVRDGGRLLAIPASQVLSVHLVREVAVVTRAGSSVVRIGREEIPLHRFPVAMARLPGSQPAVAGEFSVLVLAHRGGRIALAVDEMANEEDLIVKPLPALLQGMDRLLGAVILPDGTPAPVLNMPPMLDQVVVHGDGAPAGEAAPREEQTVLVVDDSLTMRVALTRTLKHAGYAVLAARDGLEALDLIREHGPPRLITLDIEMPRMDGLEALSAIRRTPGAERVPIFMLTSRAGEKHQRTALMLGATRYFTKPYHDREFIRAVREATLLTE